MEAIMAIDTRRTRATARAAVLLLPLLLLLQACGGGSSSTQSSAKPAPKTIDDLYAAAKQEGSFTFWGSEDTGDMAKFFALFKQRYPGVTPKQVSLPPQDVVQKLLVGQTGGQKAEVDLFNSNLDFMDPLLDKNLVDLKPGWSQYGVPASSLDPVGGILSQTTAYGLAYNTKALSQAQVPKTWDSLVDGRWAGKLSVDGRGNPWNILAVSWGEDRAVDYVKRLMSTSKPVVIVGATNGLTNLAAGETQLRPAFESDVKTWQAKGAPMGFAWLDSVPVKDTFWYLASGAAHPNAARLFAVWFSSSKEANDLQQQLAYRSTRLPDDLPQGLPLVRQTSREQYSVGAKVITAITPLLGGDAK
jgi:iron(III) transport system substrate-binding protein